jgi:hypothetical protein
MDNIEINHTNYDIEKNQTPVVQEEVTQSQRWIEDTISEINEWLDWLRLELPKTIEEQEKEVLKLVKVRWLRESFEENIYDKWVYLNKIQNWVFSLVPRDTWNVNYFVNSKWEILFGLWNIRERSFVENKKALKYAWYIEKKEDWVYNMYKIEWEKEVWPIDIDSPEYYQAWLDIIFYADVLNRLLRLKHSVETDKLNIELFIEWGSFKFEDLELFLKKWLITQEIFNYWVKEMQKVIIAQCNDERLIKLKTPVRESDLMKYYSKWYIDKDTAVECYKAMPSDMRDITNKKLKD